MNAKKPHPVDTYNKVTITLMVLDILKNGNGYWQSWKKASSWLIPASKKYILVSVNAENKKIDITFRNYIFLSLSLSPGYGIAIAHKH